MVVTAGEPPSVEEGLGEDTEHVVVAVGFVCGYPRRYPAEERACEPLVPPHLGAGADAVSRRRASQVVVEQVAFGPE